MKEENASFLFFVVFKKTLAGLEDVDGKLFDIKLYMNCLSLLKVANKKLKLTWKNMLYDYRNLFFFHYYPLFLNGYFIYNIFL